MVGACLAAQYYTLCSTLPQHRDVADRNEPYTDWLYPSGLDGAFSMSSIRVQTPEAFDHPFDPLTHITTHYATRVLKPSVLGTYILQLTMDPMGLIGANSPNQTRARIAQAQKSHRNFARSRQ